MYGEAMTVVQLLYVRATADHGSFSKAAAALTTVIAALFANAGHALRRYAGEADSYNTLQDWAALGLGGVVLPKSKFRSEVPTRAVVDNGSPALITYEAAWGPNSAHHETIDALLDAMVG